MECWYLKEGDLADTDECRKYCELDDADGLDAEIVANLTVKKYDILCDLNPEDPCSYQFTYTYTDNFKPQLIHVLEEGSECPVGQGESNSVVAVAVGVTLCAVAVALLFLLGSVLVHRWRLRHTRERNAATLAMT